MTNAEEERFLRGWKIALRFVSDHACGVTAVFFRGLEMEGADAVLDTELMAKEERNILRAAHQEKVVRNFFRPHTANADAVASQPGFPFFAGTIFEHFQLRVVAHLAAAMLD